jgi:hypothetical protein
MKPPVVIKNPVLNSPFEEPRRHYVFDDDGTTDRVAKILPPPNPVPIWRVNTARAGCGFPPRLRSTPRPT